MKCSCELRVANTLPVQTHVNVSNPMIRMTEQEVNGESPVGNGIAHIVKVKSIGTYCS